MIEEPYDANPAKYQTEPASRQAYERNSAIVATSRQRRRTRRPYDDNPAAAQALYDDSAATPMKTTPFTMRPRPNPKPTIRARLFGHKIRRERSQTSKIPTTSERGKVLGEKSASHRIQVNVRAHGLKIIVLFTVNNQRLVTPLKEMTKHLVPRIETLRVGSQEPFHA